MGTAQALPRPALLAAVRKPAGPVRRPVEGKAGCVYIPPVTAEDMRVATMRIALIHALSHSVPAIVAAKGIASALLLTAMVGDGLMRASRSAMNDMGRAALQCGTEPVR